jgi:hypothetical protein
MSENINDKDIPQVIFLTGNSVADLASDYRKGKGLDFDRDFYKLLSDQEIAIDGILRKLPEVLKEKKFGARVFSDARSQGKTEDLVQLLVDGGLDNDQSTFYIGHNYQFKGVKSLTSFLDIGLNEKVMPEYAFPRGVKNFGESHPLNVIGVGIYNMEIIDQMRMNSLLVLGDDESPNRTDAFRINMDKEKESRNMLSKALVGVFVVQFPKGTEVKKAF